MAIDRSKLANLGQFYRKHLIDDVMGFWDKRTVDPQGPGYLVPFDRQGNSIGSDKNVWCQGRQTYMYAALYNQIDQRGDWLAAARQGRDVLINQAYAGDGRWHYLLNREGEVINAAGSLFTDAFALMGLCEYAKASGSDEDLAIIERAFDAFNANLHNPDFKEFHHFQLDPANQYHGMWMVSVGLAPTLRQVLGSDRVDALGAEALEKVLYVFANDEHKVLFEALDRQGNVLATGAGQTINPGHTLESMWFCMEEAIYRNDQRSLDRAIQVADWAWDNGYDPEFGGLLGFTAPTGGKPADWQPNPFGENWDSKIWWVHSEALYTTALAALIKDCDTMWQRFEHLHDYTQKYFADHEFGEWYAYLDRQGKPTEDNKGNWIKSAFHVPRNLMKLALLFEAESAKG